MTAQYRTLRLVDISSPHLQSYDKEAESSVYFEAGQVVKTVNPE